MEFKEILEKELGDKIPKNPKLSALTKRVVLSQKDYERLQIDFVNSSYNMWCSGINTDTNPNTGPDIPILNYIKTGDAKNFSDLFTTEAEADLEAQKAETL